MLNKIFRIIKDRDLKGFIFLIILSLISVILDTLSIAVVIPLVSVIIQPDFLYKYENTIFWDFIPEFLIHLEHSKLIIFFLSFFGLIFLLKNIYLMIYHYFIASFANKLKADLTSKLLNRYLNQSYLFHVNKKYTNVIANLTTEASFLTNGIITPTIIMFSEILLLFILALLIFFLKLYKVIFIFGIFFIIGIFLIQFIKKFTAGWGKFREKEEKIRIDSINKLISGIREVILLGRKENLLKQFKISENNIAKFNINFSTLSHAPKHVFETMGVLGLIISIVFLKKIGSSTFEILTVASFFIATSYRAIPSINKILSSYQQIKYYFPVVDLLNKELNLPDGIVFLKDKFNFSKHLKLIDLSFKYPNTDKNVLDKINLSIEKGDVVGIIGVTGSGKSTLIDIISGLVKHQSGQMIIDGLIIDDLKKIRKWQNNIGYVSQNTYLMNDTIKKNIAFGLKDDEIDHDLLNEAIKISELDEFIKSLPNKLNSYVGERGVSLSGGQLQRIGIARAIYRNSEFLILDEITSSLDEKTEKKIIENIFKDKEDKTVLIVTHNSKLLKYCNKIYSVEDHKLKEINKKGTN